MNDDMLINHSLEFCPFRSAGESALDSEFETCAANLGWGSLPASPSYLAAANAFSGSPGLDGLGRSSATDLRGSETVLVCEDEDLVRRLVDKTLANFGYRVLSAPHAEAALEVDLAFADTIDLLVTDVVMPGMNGPALATRLVDRRPDLKVLFISGYSSVEVLGEGFYLHSSSFLAKPFRLTELLTSIRTLLDGQP